MYNLSNRNTHNKFVIKRLQHVNIHLHFEFRIIFEVFSRHLTSPDGDVSRFFVQNKFNYEILKFEKIMHLLNCFLIAVCR